ncbi:Polyketide synthase, enoylreductase [Pleurostoma richardsiae]|uniref:Polyketide synthase, enoylreductase n=1 Tax=Pleurostoma richardsiae TaxID=41990 RepID=A0AA38VD20_9PEZI|nr:Polyketide synthase, enoylreductase [Pleurostoma richardsiae]
MSPTNSAAWLVARSARPLEVKPAPYAAPGPGQIVIRNAAVAVNPVDWGKQVLGDLMQPYIRYPFVLGADVAGEVVEVGAGVTRFKPGDRVLGLALGAAPAVNSAAEGAFQRYTVVRAHLAAAIPESVSYEQACVLPLTLSTAAYGLFHKDLLGLDPPTIPPRPSAAPAGDAAGGRAVIVTGGASSVGCSAIQLAVAAGYQVYTTASPHNAAYLARLGAARVFDYHSAAWPADMAAELRDRPVAGALAIGNGSVEGCMEVLRLCGGGTNKFVAYAGFPLPDALPTTALGKVALVGSTAWWMGATAVRSAVRGVRSRFVDCKELHEEDSVVSKLVFDDFLPRALVEGQFVPAPEPLVVGEGLDKIQEAMDVQQKGVSAKKVVVSLPLETHA